MAGDAQMDPDELESIIKPVVEEGIVLEEAMDIDLPNMALVAPRPEEMMEIDEPGPLEENPVEDSLGSFSSSPSQPDTEDTEEDTEVTELREGDTVVTESREDDTVITYPIEEPGNIETEASAPPLDFTRPILAIQTLPLISIYLCPRCIQATSEKYAIHFGSHTHQTLVICTRCADVNKRIFAAISK